MVEDKRFTIRLQRLFSGYTSAFDDYRVLKASNTKKFGITQDLRPLKETKKSKSSKTSRRKAISRSKALA